MSSPAAAQQSCAEIEAVILQCSPDGEITGESPACACNGAPVEQLELTCERNYGCTSTSFVGDGEWPNCACVPVNATPDGPGGPGSEGSPEPGPQTDLGGAATCEAFFECPQGAEMEVRDGRCTCSIIMLPESKG
ncbi:MAG: hypothetical protein ACO1OG_07070 [Devosia sp.]